MIEKRYQVFVSSTFADLQEERREVMQALLELDCIPAGMELFPAADEDQWSLIREVIDDSDYYIVIIGGRYGSIGPSGQSYTEMEYRYAVEQGKPVLAFLHGKPEELPATQVEADQPQRQRLDDFRRLAKRRLCRFWTSAPELGGLVSRSMVRLMKKSPAIGWIRADQVASAQEMRSILDLQKRLEAAEELADEAVDGASKVGLVRAIERQAEFGTESEWLGLIHGAVERVDLMGRALYGWTESTEAADLIRRKIEEEQVQFRWLVMSPDNEFLPVLEENQVNIAADLKIKISALVRFVDSIRQGLPEECWDFIKIRTFRTVPLYFGYLRVDDKFAITHYLCSANSGSSPMMVISDVGAVWPRIYSREFETIWRLSDDPNGEPGSSSRMRCAQR